MHNKTKKKEAGQETLNQKQLVSMEGSRGLYPVSYVREIVALANSSNLLYLEVDGIKVYPQQKSKATEPYRSKSPLHKDPREEEMALLFGDAILRADTNE